jgi:hypothetical protein
MQRECALKGGARDLHKGGGVRCATAAVQDAWIHQQHTAFRVSRLCRLRAVSRSGDDEGLSRPPGFRRTLIRRCTTYGTMLRTGVASTVRAVSSLYEHRRAYRSAGAVSGAYSPRPVSTATRGANLTHQRPQGRRRRWRRTISTERARCMYPRRSTSGI